MPFENEHSARLRSPDDFNADTFRRTEGGTIFGRVAVPETIDVIWGKLKGADGPDDFPVPQALRFPVDHWTAAEARDWLEENQVTYILFEEATNTETGDEMSDDGRLATYPAEAFLLSESETNVHVMLKDEQDMPRRVRMVVNSGKPHGHGVWGSMVLDMATGSVGKQRKSILCEHNPLLIAGATDKLAIENDGQVYAEGHLTDKTEIGRERMALLSEGHPFEVSCYVVPKRVVRLSEHESREVNGREVQGPLHIFQDWKIREVSLCALGADERTSAAALSHIQGEITLHLCGTDEDGHTVDRKDGESMKGTELAEEVQVQDEEEEKPQDSEPTEDSANTDVEDAAEETAEETAEEVTEETAEGDDTTEGEAATEEEAEEPAADAELSEHHPADVERARCSAIIDKANALGLHELGKTCIDEGLTIEAATIKLQDARLKQLSDSAPPAPGPNSGEAEATSEGTELSEESLKEQWELADAKTKKAFFNTFEYYLAFHKVKAQREDG